VAKAAGTAAAEASSPQVSTARTATSRHSHAPACRAAPWPPGAAGWCGSGAVPAPRVHRPGVRRLVQPSLNGAISGLVLEYRPAGLGYQIHTCMVVRSGCQKLNVDPVLGLVFWQVLEFSSGMNVPSL
jgi:hypothetical protein